MLRDSLLEVRAGYKDAVRTPRLARKHLAFGDVFYKTGYLVFWAASKVVIRK